MPSRFWLRTMAFLVLVFGQPGSSQAADLALDYKQITLNNGMKVITLEDFGSPIVAVQVWFHVGSKDELPERQGFAHMFEHMMFRGTDRLGSTDHFDLLRRSGGSCNAYTSFDVTVYHERLPADQLELGLWLEAERIGFLKIDQKNYDTERKVVEEERRMGLNKPYGSLPEKLLAEIFPSHPYRWSPIGKIPHLRAAAVGELRDFFARYYVPNNATLVIVGAVKHEAAQKLARRYFEWLPREADPVKIKNRDPLPTQPRSITLRDDNAPAPGCGIVWRTAPAKHDDQVPLDLLATILGGGDSSRLYREIVADKQLGVAALAASVAFEQDGLFGAAGVMAPFSGNKDKILDSIRKHVEKLRSKPVTDKELTKAKNQMLSGIVTSSLTVQSKASLLGTTAVIEGDVARVNRRLERIRAVTAADLMRVAQEYLRPERALTVSVEQNLLGSLSKLMGSKEEEAPITAKAETGVAPPAKPGLRRPADFMEKPPVAALAEPKFPHDYQTRTLKNGIKVHVVSRTQVPYVNITLGFPSGAWTEEKPGTASLALGMTTKGTTRHNEKELAEELDTYAISLSGSGGMDSAYLSAGCLTEHLDRTMGLFTEALMAPTFPEAEFEKLRKQVRTSLVISEAQPAAIADRELSRRLYGSHPYARPVTGTVAELDALKIDDLKAWWGQFIHPQGAVLIFAGDIAPDRAFALAEKALGGWNPGKKSATIDKLADFPHMEPTRIFLVDRPGIQSQIRIGQRSLNRKDPLYPVARLVNGYFGDSFGSRLNETVRVKKGLTYGAGGGFSSSRFSGAFRMNTFSKTESTAAAVQLLLDEVKRLRLEAPTDKELMDTKSYMIGSVAGQHETPSSLAYELLALDLEGLPLDYSEKTLGQITKTNAAQCMNLIGKTPDPDKLIIVVVGPADRLQEELQKIAPVTVVKGTK